MTTADDPLPSSQAETTAGPGTLANITRPAADRDQREHVKRTDVPGLMDRAGPVSGSCRVQG